MSKSNRHSRRKERRNQKQATIARDPTFGNYLAQSVNGTSLAVFRIAVGVVMALEGYALLVPHDAAITYGTPLEHYFAGQDIHFHFPYGLFEWLPVLPPTGMYALAGLLIVAGVTMAIGFCYRLSAGIVFGIWAYLFVIESTRSYWQSHYYLELLVTFLLVWMPAANRWSVDSLLRRQGLHKVGGTAASSSMAVPFWSIFLLRGQLVIAYFYAGVAKLNADWLLDAAPVRWFIAEPNVLKPYEPYLTEQHFDALVSLVTLPALSYLLCYTGAVFDLAIGFLMLWPRGRLLGMVLMLVFHATNHMLIFDDIGWFPFVGMGTATIFLNADWPERFWDWLKKPQLSRPHWRWAVVGAIAVPVVGVLLGWTTERSSKNVEMTDAEKKLSRSVLVFVVLWLVTQTFLPLRQHLIDSDARFTYEGLSFSWRLKADTRHAISHSLTIQDDQVVASASPGGRTQINWSAWQGERNIYRRVRASQVNWPRLPEIVVILEPGIGERVIYNPFSGRNVSHNARVSIDRLHGIWQRIYGRKPTVLEPQSRVDIAKQLLETMRETRDTTPFLNQLRSSLPDLDRLKMGRVTSDEASTLVREFQLVIARLAQISPETVRPILRKTFPFLLQGEQYRNAPFRIIDDKELLSCDNHGYSKLARARWVHSSESIEPGSTTPYPSPQPLHVYYAGVGAEAKHLLPLAYVADVHLRPRVKPNIHWNSLRDLTPSQVMHTSAQAFYLRRYARRIAEHWEAESGRRPKVLARTSVSYNRRKYQPLVDPKADLASVPAKWFSHNEWILDMEAVRIPRASLSGERPDPSESLRGRAGKQ